MAAEIVNLADRRPKPQDGADIHCLSCDAQDFRLRYKDGKPAGIFCVWCGDPLTCGVWRFDIRGR